MMMAGKQRIWFGLVVLLADDFVLEIFENNYKSSSLFNKRVVVNTNVDISGARKTQLRVIGSRSFDIK